MQFKKLIGIIFLITGGMGIAMADSPKEKKAIFDISTQLFIDGSLISSPHMLVPAHQKASITMVDKPGKDYLKMDVIARNRNNSVKDAIQVNFDVWYKTSIDQWHSKPEFILEPNQKGTIRIAHAGHLYEMQVVAQKN